MKSSDQQPVSRVTQKRKAAPGLVASLAALMLASGLLTGCSGLSSDDVEISLPVVGNIMKGSKAKEKKIAKRNSLVLPPGLSSLPAPSNESVASLAEKSWPDDPDQKAKSDAKIAAAKEREYRRNGDWKNERKTANGLEDFNKKIDWSKRQKGIFTGGEGVSDKYRK